MSDDGYVKLHRALLRSKVWSLVGPHRLVAIACLLRANWKPAQAMYGGRSVSIPAGSFVTSLEALARDARVTKKQVRTALRRLHEAGFLAHEGARGWTQIWLTNWERYQSDEDAEGTQQGTPRARDGHAEGTNRRREEGKKGRTSRTSSSEVESAADYFLDGFNSYFGQARQPRAWLDDVRKALAAGYTADEMRGAAWGAKQRCADSPDVLRNFRPSTVLRLKSREGKTTLPQWLELADEVWDELNPGKPAPWWGKRPVLEVVRG